MSAIISQQSLSKLKLAHKRVLAQTNTAIGAAMAQAGERAVEYAKQFPRFHPRSGNLQSKNEWRMVRAPNGRILKIRNTAKYAAAIDRGARPHDIVARRKPFLTFLGKHGWVRTKRVKHPGNRPYRFLFGATQVAGRLLQNQLAASMKHIARSF